MTVRDKRGTRDMSTTACDSWRKPPLTHQFQSGSFSRTKACRRLGISADPADAVNYYMFDCKAYAPDRYVDDENIYHSSNEVTISMHPDFSREPLFSEHVGALEAIVSDTDGYTVFSDRQISGKSYTIHFSIPGCHYVCRDITQPRVSDYVMKLSHISAGYNNYMMSLWATTEGVNGILGNVGLGNPVWEHSNVSTGAGIISGAAVSEYHVPFRSLVGD